MLLTPAVKKTYNVLQSVSATNTFLHAFSSKRLNPPQFTHQRKSFLKNPPHNPTISFFAFPRSYSLNPPFPLPLCNSAILDSFQMISHHLNLDESTLFITDATTTFLSHILSLLRPFPLFFKMVHNNLIFATTILFSSLAVQLHVSVRVSLCYRK